MKVIRVSAGPEHLTAGAGPPRARSLSHQSAEFEMAAAPSAWAPADPHVVGVRRKPLIISHSITVLSQPIEEGF